MKKIIRVSLGVLVGIINTLIGSCGGIIAVEGLKREGVNQTESHATAIAIIFPLTLISAIAYLSKDYMKISDSYIFILPGLIGAILGSFILKKIPKNALSKMFSLFIIYAGVRMFLK